MHEEVMAGTTLETCIFFMSYCAESTEGHFRYLKPSLFLGEKERSLAHLLSFSLSVCSAPQQVAQVST